MTYKLVVPGANTPGFIRRERKRLAMVEAGKRLTESMTLLAQDAFFSAQVDFICEYLEGDPDGMREWVEGLSEDALNKVMAEIRGQSEDAEPDPKASEG